MPDRLRRLRRTPALRALVRETQVDAGDLILPLFVSEMATEPEPIPSMPGIFRYPLRELGAVAREVAAAGIGAVLVFGIPARKYADGQSAVDPNGIVPSAVRAIKDAAPDLVVATDVCVCAYTEEGHCGILANGEIVNDPSLELLAAQAATHAAAGADIVAPSAMMDRQVAALRAAVPQTTAIMGYSTKFASAYYGPFREAADSAPSFGDRASYQHDPANLRHARRELLADVAEGADIVMVKPGLAYLDVVRMARETCDLPVAAYHVSGEYSMIKAAAERGWLDERRIVLENLLAFRRAGADLIITYHALEAACWLNG